MSYQSRARLLERITNLEKQLETTNQAWAFDIAKKEGYATRANRAESYTQQLLSILEYGAKEGRFPRQ